MASHLEMEMNSCLTEMERLQSKMMELQQTKKQQDAEEEKKTEEIEPNLAVMEKWIESIAVIKDEYTIEQKVKNLNKNSNFMSPQSCEKVNQYEIEIFQKWTEIQQRRHNAPPRRVDEGDQEELFHIKECKNKYRPSKFMIDYIEATYNLFQIQQKKIQQLEILVAELNAKIE